MLKTVLSTKLIPHIWKLANIVPIPKPNKDIDKGHIPHLRNCKDTGEESSSIHNSKHTHTTHIQNTTLYSMILHTLNNTVAKGFNQMAPLSRTNTGVPDMSNVFDTINIHTLIRKLLQTKILDTIIKFIANYIKGRKAYATYRNHTSSQRQFKTGVP